MDMELTNGKAEVVETIEGEIDQVVFWSPEKQFFVAVVLTGNRNAKVLGTSIDNNPPPVGATMTAKGVWQVNPKPGYNEKQFKVLEYGLSMPKGSGIVKFLTNLSGIGDVRAHKIVDRLGDNALEAIVANHSCIVGLGGIGEATAEKVAHELRSLGKDADALMILTKIGLGSKARQSVLAEVGAQTILEMLASDPYKLVALPRVTFHKVDKFAVSTGRVQATSIRRGAAVAREALRLHCDWGHTFAGYDQLVKAAKGVKLATPMDSKAIEGGIKYAIEEKILIEVGPGRVALKHLAEAENGIAYILEKWMAEPFELGSMRAIDSSTLTAEQKQAIAKAISNRVSVVTGGPGTGKTFVAKSILAAMVGSTVFIVAPTGKAACRAKQLTGCEASTIHRFIGKIASELKGTPDRQPEPEEVIPQVVLIDEASMVDTELFYKLLKTLDQRENARIVVVGDTNQLPSIGPGRVLADFIESYRIPVTKLTQVQRQKGDSTIIANAHVINTAQANEPFGLREAQDFTIIDHPKPALLRDRMLDYLTKLRDEGYDLMEQVQVLSGQRNNTLGTLELNKAIRELLNPKDASKDEYTDRFGNSFRMGDKVMVTQNDYTLGVVNGDQGVVIGIRKPDIENKAMVTIRLMGNGCSEIGFEDDDIDMLTQAWAVTVHKSQGSEYPVVLVVCHNELEWALQRALLYTAVTRGKERVVIFGTHADIRKAAISETPMRYTRLGQLLYSDPAF